MLITFKIICRDFKALRFKAVRFKVLRFKALRFPSGCQITLSEQKMEFTLGAPASFGEQDAGSGPVHSSPSFGPITTAIHNIAARNLHEIGASLPDDRQFLRSWRRQLQDCMTAQSGRVVKYLLADASANITEADITRRCTELLTKYSRPTLTFGSSIRDLSLSASTDDVSADIEREIGIAPAALRDTMKRAVRLYVNTASAVTAAEGRLEEKLKRIETVMGRINELMFLEPTPELAALGPPAREYLDSVLNRISLEEDYNDMVSQYKKFSVLRGIVSLNNFQRTQTAPTCSVCMVREVNQCMVPCGHTFCEECCGRQMTACYVCRVQIRDKVRLYFS